MERIRSGNPQLDEILGGGFPSHSIHIVMGNPGAGKTILAEQIAFTNATKQRPALYLTTVSEPLPKFLTYLQEYSFADVSRVGEEVVYAAIGDALIADPRGITELVVDRLQKHRPGVIVIDSFKAVTDLMPDTATARRHLHELAGILSAYSATTFWVGEYATDMSSQLPEFAIADGVLELQRHLSGTRDFRFLRVAKLRGSDFLDGRHAFRITASGLDVFPRLRTPPITPDYAPVDERVSSGIAGLDPMIEHGWLRGSTTIVAGPSGSGKTLLALQFAREGVRRGDPALFVSFEENPVQIARVVHSLGWSPGELIAPDKLDVAFCSPVELQIDTIVREIFGRIEQNGARRVVLDGIAQLSSTADDPIRLRDYLFSLTQHFAARGVTAMLTCETRGLEFGFTREGISYLGDNLLLLELALRDPVERFLRVIKTRGSGHELSRRRLSLRRGGVSVE